MDIDLEQEKSIGKLFSEINSLRTSVIGIDGQNGLRGELRGFTIKMEQRMDKQDKALNELNDWRNETSHALTEFITYSRRDTCYGIKALNEYKKEKDKECQEIKEHQTELKKARLTTMSAVIVALLTAIASVLPTLIELMR
jgi:hypothetical protein